MVSDLFICDAETVGSIISPAIVNRRIFIENISIKKLASIHSHTRSDRTDFPGNFHKQEYWRKLQMEKYRKWKIRF